LTAFLAPFLFTSFELSRFISSAVLSLTITIIGSKLRIFDIVLYHNEAFMLYLRLRTLAPYITKYYIGFSDVSFSSKVLVNLSFDPLNSEIRSFADRCFWLKYTYPSNELGPWIRETKFRHVLLAKMEELERPTMNDLIIWSDLDEIPLQSGLKWILANPPAHFYRFVGYFHFYNYRWQSSNFWEWAYVMRYGSKRPDKTWFQYRIPDFPPFEYVPNISLIHCSYCFPKMGLIIQKLFSFSHVEYTWGHWIDPNWVYSHVYCGASLFGGNFTLVDFNPEGLDFPENDERFNFLKRKMDFSDLDNFTFDFEKMKTFAPCNLSFLEKGTAPIHIIE
jgi:hypothetical protein